MTPGHLGGGEIHGRGEGQQGEPELPPPCFVTPICGGGRGAPSGDDPLEGQLEVASQGGWQGQFGDSGVAAGTQVLPDGTAGQVLQPARLTCHAHRRGVEIPVLLEKMGGRQDTEG